MGWVNSLKRFGRRPIIILFQKDISPISVDILLSYCVPILHIFMSKLNGQLVKEFFLLSSISPLQFHSPDLDISTFHYQLANFGSIEKIPPYKPKYDVPRFSCF